MKIKGWSCLAIFLVLIFIFSIISLPPGNSDVSAWQGDYTNLSLPVELSGNSEVDSFDYNIPDETLLQFSADGHVLGFAPQAVYLAGLDHALQVEFVDSKPVLPVAESSGLTENEIAPLKSVTYHETWPAIDVVFSAVKSGIAESTYIIYPGGDPSAINLQYNVPVEVTPAGGLRLSFESGFMTESAPVAWQNIDGIRKPVDVDFLLQPENRIGFELGYYDPNHILYIDPVYQWHTFYGSANIDTGTSIAVDPSSGSIYIAGTSNTEWDGPGDTPPLNPYTGAGNNDMVVVKLDSAGSYQWHSFFGTELMDFCSSIAVDSAGNVIIAGHTARSFKVDASDPINPYTNWGPDVVIIKLASDGTYLWHTFHGGTHQDHASAVAVDTSNNIYVVGSAWTTWDGPNGEAPKNAGGGYQKTLVLKLNYNGGYEWHGFYGYGTKNLGRGIAVNSLTGYIYTVSVSNTAGTDQSLVQKIQSSNGTFVNHVYLGSDDGEDQPKSITVANTSGNVYLTGYSVNSWYGPGDIAPINPHPGDYSRNAFIIKLDSDLEYQWHTFHGPMQTEGWDIALDSSENVYVTGDSHGPFLGTGGREPLDGYNGKYDQFVIKLNNGGKYEWHTFLGSPENDYGRGIAINPANDLFLVGHSYATWNGPGSVPPLKAHSGSGGLDITVTKLDGNPTTHRLEVNSVNPGSGVVISSSNGYGGITAYEHEVIAGFSVNLEAPEYHGQGVDRKLFSHWTGDHPPGQQNDRSITITMNTAKSITAVFDDDPIYAPLPPVLLTPAEGSLPTSSGISFTWEASEGAEFYHYIVENLSDHTTHAELENAASTAAYIVGFPQDGTDFQWRVRAGKGPVGDRIYGDWSEWATFSSVTHLPPPKVVHIYPTADSTVEGAFVQFQWEPSPAATYYVLQVYNAENASVIFNQNIGNVTAYIIDGLPNDGTILRWRVLAYNHNGYDTSDIPSWIYFQNGTTPEYSVTVNSALAPSGENFPGVIMTSITGHGGTTTFSHTVGLETWVRVEAPIYVGSGTARKKFDHWSGDHQGTNSSIDLTIEKDTIITANYIDDPVIISYTLTVNSTNPSSGISIGSRTDHVGITSYQLTVNEGTEVNLVAPEFFGSGESRKSFINWSGGVTSSERSITLTMSENRTVTANYVDNPDIGTDASLSALTVSIGTLSPAFDPRTIAYSVGVAHNVGSIDVTATLSDPNASMTINGEPVKSGGPKTVTLNSAGMTTVIDIVVTAEDNSTQKTYTITVNRADEEPVTEYTITVSANPTDGGMVSGGGIFDQGDSVTVTATANTGYEFVNWTEEGTEVHDQTDYTFTAEADRDLVANFSAVTSGQIDAVVLEVEAGVEYVEAGLISWGIAYFVGPGDPLYDYVGGGPIVGILSGIKYVDIISYATQYFIHNGDVAQAIAAANELDQSIVEKIVIYEP